MLCKVGCKIFRVWLSIVYKRFQPRPGPLQTLGSHTLRIFQHCFRGTESTAEICPKNVSDYILMFTCGLQRDLASRLGLFIEMATFISFRALCHQENENKKDSDELVGHDYK